MKANDFASYIETSSLLGTNVKNVFDEAIQQVFVSRCEKAGLKLDNAGIRLLNYSDGKGKPNKST